MNITIEPDMIIVIYIAIHFRLISFLIYVMNELIVKNLLFFWHHIWESHSQNKIHI